MSFSSQSNFLFVESSENDLGIGKLIRLDEKLGKIEYFRSPADIEQIIEIVSPNSIEEVYLPLETRVYYENPETLITEVGRVLDYLEVDQRYLIRFPNHQSRLLPSDELQVRCNLPIVEPTDFLAFQLNETAFWHKGRSEFVRHLLKQHRVNCGLPALISSSVELVAHQASVIRRVLMDPFQRYLLADEVGLGKTIEAGVLIRQFTLDEPDHHDTLIIVPDSLLVQWQQELTHRFHLGALLGRTVHIVSSSKTKTISELCQIARLIVIDEAHHLSSWAWSTSHNERQIFDTVKDCVENPNMNVLLLSATPALHNEKSFLAMLHLLDPQVYPLDSIEVFKKRVRMRQEIAECMMSLDESESNFFLKGALEELSKILKSDAEFQALQIKLVDLLNEDVNENDPIRNNLILLIRTHVSDMWRLHRRILRNRRTERIDAYIPGRAGLKKMLYQCDAEKGLAEAVESWRLSLSAACYDSDSSHKVFANTLVLKMEEYAVCEPRRVITFALERLNSSIASTKQIPLSDQIALIDGEEELLNQIVRAAKDCDHDAKLFNLLRLVRMESNNRSFVIFANFEETADRIFSFLKFHLSSGKVLRHSSIKTDWMQYNNKQGGYILVCDRISEEGLNLQKRGAIAIHFDLPFSPNRIEQRMGRLDRFGVGMPIQSIALVCDEYMVQNQWCDLLNEALKVFNRSIASLQYVIEESMEQVLNEFLDSGGDTFADASLLMGGDEGTISVELKKIRAQDEIDSFDAGQISQQLADKLEDDDRKLSQESMSIFKKWVTQDLHFRQVGEDDRQDKVFSYEFTRRVDNGGRPYGRDTLMPENEFTLRFRDSIDDLPVELPTKHVTVPMTFDRVLSQQRQTRLLRVGDPFVDAFEQFTRWDDRGICFAFWRVVPNYRSSNNPDLFFRFDYVVRPNPQPLNDLCKSFPGANVSALIRRTEAIMPPTFASFWLDSNFEKVATDDSRFSLLKSPFDKKRHDYNLNYDRWQRVEKLYDMSLWRDMCFSARRHSEILLREQTQLHVWVQECIGKAKTLAKQIAQQYRSRMTMVEEQILNSLESDYKFEKAFLEAQIDALSNPELRVDSVGAIFISPKMPFIERLEEEDEF